jgi:hypothetical protein
MIGDEAGKLGKALDEGVVRGVSKAYKDLVIIVGKFKGWKSLSMVKCSALTSAGGGQEECGILAGRCCSRELLFWKK